MALRTDLFDLRGLRLAPGEGRRLDLAVAIDPFDLAGQTYRVVPPVVPLHLNASRTTGSGHALRLGLTAALTGPCMRCLEEASAELEVSAMEVSQPGEGDDLASPYVHEGLLDLQAWARDALALALPTQILCRPDCAGLCAVCGADLNRFDPTHHHDAAPDPRWAKLSELRLP